MSSKKSPFDYVKSINQKSFETDLSGYVPFLTNRAFSMHMDTIMLAEQMNQYHQLSPQLQYDFYYYAVRKGKRFGFPKKVEDPPNLELVQTYYQYSREKALQALEILTPEQLAQMKASLDKGGR